MQQNNFYNLVGGRLFKAQQLMSCLIKLCVCLLNVTFPVLGIQLLQGSLTLLGGAPHIPSSARQGVPPPCVPPELYYVMIQTWVKH